MQDDSDYDIATHRRSDLAAPDDAAIEQAVGAALSMNGCRRAEISIALVDDEPIPVLSLAERLRIDSVDPGLSSVPLVISEMRGERVALRVDRFEGQQEIYVKPVPELLASVRILSGLTVLEDGSPVFLLDLNHLV